VLNGKQICLIAAMDRHRVIGRDGDMPWHLPADLAHFKTITMGLPIVMGRKTWASIGRPLPGRQNIVITRDRDSQIDGCDVANSLEQGIKLAEKDPVMVIGGGEIYRMAMPVADRLFITEVNTSVADGDTVFPEIEPNHWHQIRRQTRPADDKNAFELAFVEYVRRDD
jgi:dihydrofolate reductase